MYKLLPKITVRNSICNQSIHLANKCKHFPICLHALIFGLFVFNLDEKFDYTLLENIAGNWHYKNIVAKHVIFCEGYENIHNPFFNYLPFVLCKGEVFTIKCNDIAKDKIIKKGSTVQKRKFWVDFFKYYLLIALFMIAPIVLVIYNILIRPFSIKRINKNKAYFHGIQLNKK